MKLQNYILPLFGLFLLTGLLCQAQELSTPSPVQSTESPKVDYSSEDYDLTGTWTLLLSNSLTRRQVTLRLKQKDKRPRGKLSGRGIPLQKLDGRIEKDNRVKFWGTHFDRAGNSSELDFRGVIEGSPGNEKISGKALLFRKNYKFIGTRAQKKTKKRRSR